ncbi:hypothetical protein [Pseudoduganella chitinolytica]|uniref:Porin n=1 Tax=Pseudoduganella chitinolytica TaxID=34070 RepID=A0ABY8BGR9_9BURK|nr:hypothetical protein [Pseudoduganella chitinolytica]WEF35090.1 hypothetical protein PX653_10105 [Pseudoduganella chitinolytica]
MPRSCRPVCHRYRRVRVAACILAAAAVLPGGVLAQESSAAVASDLAGPRWTFGGFGTVGAVHSSEKNADYAATPLSPGQAGYSRDWAFDVDSRLGAQLAVQVDKRWSGVIQVITERTVTAGFQPHLEWANVKYQATPDLSIRVGRIAAPMFLAADYRKASFALPWVRPPVELYSTMPITNSDGVDAAYRWHTGTVRHTTQAFLGTTRIKLAREYTARARHGGLNHTAVLGALTLGLSVSQARLEIPGTDELFDVLDRFGPQGQALSARYDLRSTRTNVFGAGFNYDPGNWFVQGEIGRVNTRSMLGDQTGAYVSAGYRYGALTPFVTLSNVRANMATNIEGIATAGLPPAAAALAAQANDILNGFLREVPDQGGVSLGLRWDVAPNYAVKLQFDAAKPRNGSVGSLVNVQPGFRSDRAFHVFSASVDFVF